MPEAPGSQNATDRQQADLLFGLIHVGPDLLQQFIDGVRRELEELRALCHEADESGRYRDIIEPAFRLVHGIKGNAALFDLTAYREYSDELEDRLQEPRCSPHPPSQSWLDGFMENVEAMEHALTETERLLAGLVEMQRASAATQTATQSLLTNLRLLVDGLCADLDKRVRLSCIAFDLEALRADVYHDVVEVVTQLVRNAVAHGIETRDRRRRAGKPPVGRIWLQTGRREHGWFVRVQDDGGGPDFERLTALAAAHRRCSPDEAAALGREWLAEWMFSAGVSTVGEHTEAAGRGVGMGVVLGHVHELNGRLELRYAAGGGCRFDVLLPQDALKGS